MDKLGLQGSQVHFFFKDYDICWAAMHTPQFLAKIERLKNASSEKPSPSDVRRAGVAMRRQSRRRLKSSEQTEALVRRPCWRKFDTSCRM